MLLKHSLMYGLARGVPGIVNFLAITIYTRWMGASEYGQYALVLAAVGLFDSVIFQWIRAGLLRFLPAHAERPQVLLSTLFIAFLAVIALTAAMGVLALLVWPEQFDRRLLAVGVALLWVQGWYELNLELARSQLAPVRYGMMSIFKSVLALAIGFLLLLQGMGTMAPLLGLLSGMVLASLLFALHGWRILRRDTFDRQLLVQLIRYGAPMTATYALSFLVSSSDRFLLGWFMGADAPGLYAPGYDLAQFSLIMLMSIVNLAAYPMVMRALDSEGVAAARCQLDKMLLLLVATALPVAVGMVLCRGNVAYVLLGEPYRDSATMLIPFISLASFLLGIKVFYLNLSFQLSKKTYLEPRIMLWAALVNLLLNLWWIPLYGLAGAASATVVAYFLGACLSWRLGRRVFQLPPLSAEAWKVLAATLVMAFSLWLVADLRGIVALMYQLAIGGAVYITVLLLLDAAGVRRAIRVRMGS